MELVILQYFVIAQTLSVLLFDAVPGYNIVGDIASPENEKSCPPW